ncbi:patatin-like phospholipase domain-containing protein 2 [Thalassophryne amazonica]|uniref:patatin-like phospholipase domain-containing protein 2 n=1 Tax=Thalassophryne amazonica TaxID=390379 RepID=UPI00147226ED|nr:patatin-like phospholipase domain-containing protein 2 [Thalassophryne amazonica]
MWELISCDQVRSFRVELYHLLGPLPVCELISSDRSCVGLCHLIGPLPMPELTSSDQSTYMHISTAIIRVTIWDEILDLAKWIKTFLFGPFHPSVNVFHWLECVLYKYVPSDADQLASGRLAVTMTRLTDGECVVISEFNSKEDVIQALLCSCFVPGYCGMQPPSFKGVFYVDGGLSSMQPVLNATCNSTLTICPFSGETDICPLDTPSMWDMAVNGITLKVNIANCLRFINALYPMALEVRRLLYICCED